MNNILDEIEIEKQAGKLFSKLSLVISLITLGLLCCFFLNISGQIKASEEFLAPSMAAIIGTQVSCLSGVIITVLSFVKREPSTWFKWIGAILNILIFLILAGAVIFSRAV